MIVYYNQHFMWQIFRRPIIADVVQYTKAVLALHNYLQVEESSVYCPSEFADKQDSHDNIVHGAWRSEGSVTGLTLLGNGESYANQSYYLFHVFTVYA